MTSPNRITVIDEQLANEVRRQGTAGDLQQKISAKTKVVEENDEYPGFMKNRIYVLNERMSEISTARWMSSSVIGIVSIYFMAVGGMVAGIGAALTVAACATACVAAIYGGTYPHFRRLRKEEAETAAELGSYLRARSLVMASRANETGVVPAATPSSPKEGFASVANGNQQTAQPKPLDGSADKSGPIKSNGLNRKNGKNA